MFSSFGFKGSAFVGSWLKKKLGKKTTFRGIYAYVCAEEVFYFNLVSY